MTITVLPSRNEYTANAGQTIFNYTFKIFESTDLNVYVTPAGQECSDSDLTTAYTVSGIGDPAGGSITLNTATSDGDLVTIVSAIPSERTTDYQNNGDFRPDTVNEDFDRVVSIVKKIEDKVNRAPLLSECNQGPKPIGLSNPEDGKSLIWSESENKFVNFTPSEALPDVPEGEVLGEFTNYCFNTVSDAVNGITDSGFLVNLTLNQTVNTKGRLSIDDGSGANYLVVAGGTGATGDGRYYDTNNGLQLKLKSETTADIRKFNGNNRASLLAAIDHAVQNGSYQVYIPYLTFDVTTSDIDCKGCDIIGSNTVITGNSLINFNTLQNCVIEGQKTDDRAIHPTTKRDLGLKVIVRDTANDVTVFHRKTSKGYLRTQLRNDVTTPFDSLATTSTDITSWRVASITNCVDVIVGYKTASATVGTWNDVNLISGIEETFNGGQEYQYKQGGASEAYSMDIEIPASGYFNVGVLRSGSSSTDVTIDVNGTPVDSNFSLQSSSGAILEIREYKAEPGIKTVTITNNLASGLINLLGCNVFKLKDAINGLSYDSVGYYRNSTNYTDYLLNTSANDYAIRDKDADIWGGSYHGGESAITTDWIVNGEVVDISVVGTTLVGQSVDVKQSFVIDWSGLGGATLDCYTVHSFFSGGYNFESTFDGTIRTESAFTTLYGIDQNFDLLKAPKIVNISTDLVDRDRVFLGRGNHVQYEADTGQTFSITHSIFNREDNEKGGAYVYRVDGEYNKYYYAPADRGDRTFNTISAVNVFEFG